MCQGICRGSEWREWDVTAHGRGAGYESRLKPIHPVTKLVLLLYTKANRSYRRKFKADLQNVTERVQTTLSELGRDINEITSDEIESFVKHAGYLKVLRYRSLEEEYTSPKTKFLRTPPLPPPVV